MGQIVKTPEKPDGPLQRERETAILAAARAQFAHFGFDKVTMEDVAKAVGVVKGSVYYYYPTKESLFRAVIEQEQREFLERIGTLLDASLSAQETLRLYVDKRQHYFREMVNLSQLDYHSWMKLTSHFNDLFTAFEEREVEIIERVLKRGISEKTFAHCDSRQRASLFLHLLQGLRLRTMKDTKPPFHDSRKYSLLNQETRQFVDLFLSSIHTKSSKENT